MKNIVDIEMMQINQAAVQPVKKTIQPFIVMNTSHFYQHIVNQFGISHFYSYSIDNQSAKTMTGVPDGCVDIQFEYGTKGVKGWVYGTVLEHTEIKNKYGKNYFGVRFMPGVVPAVIQIAMKELTSQCISLDELTPTKGLYMKLEQADSFEEKIRVFMTFYMKAFSNVEKADNRKMLLTAVKEIIYETDGSIKISEIESYIGYTARYINRIFAEDMGISAKTFCEIIKFQKILDVLSHDTQTSLLEVAMEHGYYDQSHFIHDFKKKVGMTPKQYRRMILEYTYENRLVEWKVV